MRASTSTSKPIYFYWLCSDNFVHIHNAFQLCLSLSPSVSHPYQTLFSSLWFSFPSSCLLIFVSWPTEFYKGHLNDHRYGTIQRSLVGSIVGTYLKMMTTSSPESLSFWKGGSWGQILCRSTVSNHSSYEVMVGMAVPCPEDNILQPFSLSLVISSSMIFPEPKVDSECSIQGWAFSCFLILWPLNSQGSLHSLLFLVKGSFPS